MSSRLTLPLPYTWLLRPCMCFYNLLFLNNGLTLFFFFEFGYILINFKKPFPINISHRWLDFLLISISQFEYFPFYNWDTKPDGLHGVYFGLPGSPKGILKWKPYITVTVTWKVSRFTTFLISQEMSRKSRFYLTFAQ